MPKQRYRVVLEQTGDGVLIGTVPALKGFYSSGKTLEELKANLQEAVKMQGETSEPAEKKPTGTRFAGVLELEIEV